MLLPNFSSGYSTFDPSTDIPNLSGKVVLITGANSGIGFTTALLLARHGAKVYVGARDEVRGKAAVAKIKAEIASTPSRGTVQWVSIDVGTPLKAKAGADAFLAVEDRLDVLINNAGLILQPYNSVSEGGLEINDMMATNHLGPFVLTQALTPILQKTAELPGSDVRIIGVSSEFHKYIPPNMNFRTLEGWNVKGNSMIENTRRYGMSKLANILWINELQSRFDAQKTPITCVSLHPGLVYTEGNISYGKRNGLVGAMSNWFIRTYNLTPERGAYTTIFAATSTKDKEKLKGAYLVPFDRKIEPSKQAKDRNGLGKDLWKCSEELAEKCLRAGN